MKLVEVEQLSIGYGEKALIEDIKLNLEKGEIITLIGPNGSGKTTLLKTVAGILEKKCGCIYIDGKELKQLSEKDRAKMMSIMFTDRRKFDYVTCLDVISVGRFPYTGVLGKLSREDYEIIERVMRLTDVEDIAYKDFSKISDGQKQRVLLARALVQQPKILILDEPTSFLDVGYKIEFMNIIKGISKEENIGVIMSLHELDLAAAVSDRVIAINADNIVSKQGTPDEVLTEEYISKLFNIEKGSYSIRNGFTIDNCTCNFSDASKEPNSNCNVSNYIESDSKKNMEQGRTHFIMVQGTMSSAGKSLVVAGLCRIFRQDGYRVSPFKSQNMALNSYITEDGLEMGRAQVMQAEAAKVKPSVYMNPILLKPTDNFGSQVIVNGEVRGNMKAKEYFEYKKQLIPDIEAAIEFLKKENDIIVIEGAGSPAEINLKKNDIVNMGMAKLVDAPVVLVGDIDRGGVFAQLLGTVELLEDDEKNRVKGLIINKFRGDKSILDPGIDMLFERGKIPIVGVLPYMDINLEDEDSLTDKFNRKTKGLINIGIVKLPHISNFTDFDVFEQFADVSISYIKNYHDLENKDMIIIPGTKNTISDMKWLKENGFDVVIRRMAKTGIPVFGICGGYQILGKVIEDPDCVEAGGKIEGIGLLPVSTRLCSKKQRSQVQGTLPQLEGIFESLSGKKYYGYEIHMGQSVGCEAVICCKDNIYGTYIHGFFDHEEIVTNVIKSLAKKNEIEVILDEIIDYRDFKEKEYDRLADMMRACMDMSKIYEMMGIRDEKEND